MQEQKATQKAIKLEKKQKVNTMLPAGWVTDGVGGEGRGRLGEGQGFAADPLCMSVAGGRGWVLTGTRAAHCCAERVLVMIRFNFGLRP